jgi:alanine racemase
MTRPASVVIDLAAARANLERVRELTPRQKIMAIIKANAYGHGLVRMARALRAADAFGVACLEEAQVLREAGVTHPVVMLEGPFSASELSELQRLGIDTVVHHEEQVRMLESLTAGPSLGVWLKVDTGMHRLGFPPQRVGEMWKRLTACPLVAEPLGLMTHLASAHERGHSTVTRQLQCFEDATQGIEAERCIANSSAILAWPESHGAWVRPGLMLYGVSPFGDTLAADEGLHPVMTLRSQLIAVQRVRAGECVGYGGTWRCPKDMPVGIVAMGYGDGYPRHAESGTPVLVNGQRAALIGRTSMDMLTVDLRRCPDAQAGDPVVLWGEGLPVEEVARSASTIPYELLCGVPLRARFIESGEG